MISLGLDTLLILYLSGGIGLIFGLWFFYDRREKKILHARTQKTVFHCVKCSHLYAIDRKAESDSCPKCGFKNARLGF